MCIRDSGQKGHIKKYCKNKPSKSYIEYCKTNYPCNKCNEKGHFAKNCTKNVDSKSEKSDKSTSKSKLMINVGCLLLIYNIYQ